MKYKSVIDRASTYYDSSINNQDKLISKKTKFKFYKENRHSFKNRTLYRVNSSAYLFDFGTGSVKSLFILLIFFMAIYQILFLDLMVLNINAFENGISFLQLCSDTGINLKESFNELLLEGFSLSFKWSDINNFNGGFFDLLEVLVLPFKSIYYLFSFIFSFLNILFNFLFGLLGILMGA